MPNPRFFYLMCFFTVACVGGRAQSFHHSFSLDEVIAQAHEQSPSALVAKHNFRASYWQFRSYQARLLPSLNLNGTLGNYNRSLVDLQDPQTGEIKYISNNNMRNNLSLSVDQKYQLFVAFDFIGPYELANRVTQSHTEQINEILPLGFQARVESYSGNGREESRQYLLILLIVAIIYFIGAILFESLLQPLVVISLIPISFVGVFLTFYLTGYRFDQGGFASFVLLCGLTVNAGFYVINEYNHLRKNRPKHPLQNYLKAYNRKIVPILLTIISSVLGLIPFLFEGDSEVFWFSFAVGTMGGMVFNLIALLFYLPLFMPMKTKMNQK